MDFISGASMVASRAFYASAGPMAEDYFLYYEEVDWAMQRGDLPLAYCPDALVYHRAGTAIGSPTPGQVGSALSIYFKHRNRMRFLKRYRPASSLSAQIFTLAKAMQILLKGHPHEARVLVSAAFGASPTRDVRRRLSPAAAERAFAPPLGASTRETGHAR
jgi:GT2 family glycosyltransferase